MKYDIPDTGHRPWTVSIAVEQATDAQELKASMTTDGYAMVDADATKLLVEAGVEVRCFQVAARMHSREVGRLVYYGPKWAAEALFMTLYGCPQGRVVRALKRLNVDGELRQEFGSVYAICERERTAEWLTDLTR